METKEKRIREDKKEIADRLRSSDVEKWNSLSPEDQKAVVDEFYDFRTPKSFEINKILDDNRNLRQTLYTLVLGLLLGIFGNIFADIIIQYKPKGPIFDFIAIVLFFLLLWGLVKQIQNLIAEHLNEGEVLDYFLAIVKKKQSEKSTDHSA
ncbi:MAG TPA: hypothetical protein VMA75_00515 [Candidatus Paceibacterota bacterium]|nr:hypothetical protein [Candidatus Paceibacterota bacterium]